jgi:phospholipid transport system substrate-binding protein
VYPVTFQMKKDAQGNWKTQNLIVNGINLGLTFRNQFAAAVDANNGSIDRAIAGWAPDTQVAKGKSP